MEHQPGEIIHGRYKIIKIIGRGAFGETYVVEDTESPGLIFLLKYLRPQNNDPEALKTAQRLFKDEANTLRRLGNGNQSIPKLYDYFEENKRFYLVQEYIDGENLQEELRTQIFSENQVIEILSDVLKILCYLCENEVIHRDIKPANLIRRKLDGKIFLIDFGAVKEISTLSINAQGQATPTIAIGTPFFMPPEQIARHPNYTSDIYALGITAFVLFGRIPQRTQNDEIIWNGLTINPYLATILNKMVRSDYKERYQRAEDVLLDLQPLTLLGKTLNQRYEINNYLGSGELGHTYLATDRQRSYQQICVIKQLRLRSNNQQIWQEAQHRFANVVTKLENLPPNQKIPRLLNHFQEHKIFYLVYEFVEGKALNTKINSGDRLSEPEVIALLKDVLDILTIIHQQGIIHGDIKPSNLIQKQKENKYYLIDVAEFKQIVTLENIGQKLVVSPGGTHGYMPPEQMQNRLQHCSDIYALGMTAIQALTGKPPEQLQIDAQGEIIWQNQAQVSRKLAKILTKMVRFQCGSRYQSAQAVINALETIDLWRSPSFNRLLKQAAFGVVSISVIIIIYKIAIIIQSDSLWKQGEKLFKKGKYEDAIIKYDEALKIDPKLAEAMIDKGVAYGRLMNFTLQLYYCNQGIQIEPNSSEGLLCVGNANHDLKKYEEAIKNFRKLEQLTCNSNDPEVLKLCYDAWNAKGDTLLEQKNPAAALQEFDKVLQKDNTRHITWTNKGRALIKLKRCAEALDAFNAALELQKGYTYAVSGKEEAQKNSCKSLL